MPILSHGSFLHTCGNPCSFNDQRCQRFPASESAKILKDSDYPLATTRIEGSSGLRRRNRPASSLEVVIATAFRPGEENFCIQSYSNGGYIGDSVKSNLCVEPAEDQTTQFDKSGDSHVPEACKDAWLLAAVAEGDQHALAALYRRRSGLIYSLLVRMLVNEMEAQESIQDTFLQIWRRAREYDPE